MSVLPLELTARVAKLLPRLNSNHDGEVAATAAAIQRTLKAAGHDWHDLAEHVAAEPRTVVVYRERPAEPSSSSFSYDSWHHGFRGRHDAGFRHSAQIKFCQSNAPSLSAWESQFVSSIAFRLTGGRSLTPKQATTLQGIVNRIGGAA